MKFLIVTITHWDEPPRARHQVTYALAKKHEVVFVTANQRGLPKIKIDQLDKNLTVLTPYYLPGIKLRYRLPVINEIYQIWLFRKLRKLYKDYVVINFDFTATLIFRFFKDVVYYCNDNFTGISANINPFPIAKYHQYCESKIASKAIFCVAVSTILRNNLLKYNSNTFEIPLGSPDISDFNIEPVSLNAGKKNGNIHVGLVGFIRLRNISYDAINNLLKNKNITVTLIGPVEEKFLEKIVSRENLVVLGPKTGKELYDELNNIDIAIAPYCERLRNDAYSGVGTGSKIYHYFAVGKPVIISYMPGLDNIQLPEGFLYIARSDDEYPALLEKALQENTEELIKKRIEYSKLNTWEMRMESFISTLNGFKKN